MTTRVAADDDPLDYEIDFSKSRPNPYWLGTVDRSCVRLLPSDLAEAFPDDAVNEALRMILQSRAAQENKADEEDRER
jgi:hypothetical protein